MKFLGTPMHHYVKVRVETPPILPCDACMGGMDAPWHLAFYLGDVAQIERHEAPLAYVLCAYCSTRIAQLVDLCGEDVLDPGDERSCDVCGRDYTPGKPVDNPVEVPA